MKRSIGIRLDGDLATVGGYRRGGGRPGSFHPVDGVPADGTVSLDRFRMPETSAWRPARTVAGLAGRDMVFRFLHLREADETARAEAIRREWERFPGLDPSDAVTGWVAYGGPARQDVLLAITRADTVERAAGRLEAAGLDVVDLTPAPLALHAGILTRRNPAPGLPFVALEVGPASLDLVVGNEDRVLFAQGLDRPALLTPEALVEAVEQTLEWHRESLREPMAPPAVLWISGMMPGPELRRLAMDRLGLPVEVFAEHAARDGNPLISAVATGLALHADAAPEQTLSLLPGEVRQAKVVSARNRQWMVAALVVLGTTLAFTAQALWQDTLTSRALEGSVALRQARQQTDAELTVLRDDLNRYARALSRLQQQERKSEIIRGVLEAVSHSKGAEDWVVRVADAGAYFQGAPVPAAAVPPPPGLIASGGGAQTLPAVATPTPDLAVAAREVDPQAAYVIEGYTVSDDLGSLRNFIENLKVHPMVVAADLLSDDLIRLREEVDRRWEPLGGRLFAIEIRVQAP